MSIAEDFFLKMSLALDDILMETDLDEKSQEDLIRSAGCKFISVSLYNLPEEQIGKKLDESIVEIKNITSLMRIIKGNI